jgi:hypothetical protein
VLRAKLELDIHTTSCGRRADLEFRLVTVHVRLFAGLRERAGWSAREIEARTVADVWPALGLGDEPEAFSTRSTASTPNATGS